MGLPVLNAFPVYSFQHPEPETGNRMLVAECWEPRQNGRKEWATVGQYDPKRLGYTRHTVDRTMGCYSERRCQSSKSIRGLDRGLQLTLVKMEWLVIACHYHAVNVSPLLAHTARQVTQMFSR